jgi:hypothetical protein
MDASKRRSDRHEPEVDDLSAAAREAETVKKRPESAILN